MLCGMRSPLSIIRLISIVILVWSGVITLVRMLVDFDFSRCNVVLEHGGWLDSKTPALWQTQGCILKTYKKPDIRRCLAHRPIVFVGDSIARGLFEQLARRLDPVYRIKDEDEANTVHAMDSYPLKFIWKPRLNESHQELAAMNEDRALVVVSVGHWHLTQYQGDDFVDQLASDVDRFLGQMQHSMTKDGIAIFLPMTKLQSGSHLQLAAGSRPDDTQAVEDINTFLRGLRVIPGMLYADAIARMSTSAGLQGVDGVQYKETVNDAILDILLNHHCTNVLEFETNDIETSHCCSGPTEMILSQKVLLSLTFALLLTLAALSTFDCCSTEWAAWAAIAMLCGIGFYVVEAEQSRSFGKAIKQFKVLPFAALHLMASLVGSTFPEQTEKDPGILSPQQTDEWKGWLQLLLLFYDYFGASYYPSLYVYSRVLVAGYLFASGFDNTRSLLQKPDYSFKRLISKVIRLNLLTCFLAFMTDRNVLYYYIPPLVTFWYCCIYLTLRIRNDLNTSFDSLLVKLLLMVIVSTVIVRVDGIFERAGEALASLTNVNWDMTEWRARLALDLYAAPAGMLFAILQLHLPGKIKQLSERTWLFVRVLAIVGAALVCLSYATISLDTISKHRYNTMHPYLSPFVVVAYVLLRNATPYLRKTHSQFFAFWGQLSIEAFVLEQHVLFAGDSRYLIVMPVAEVVLEILPWQLGRAYNFVLTMAIFFWFSTTASRATSLLTQWFVSDLDGKKPQAVEEIEMAEHGAVNHANATPRFHSKLLNKLVKLVRLTRYFYFRVVLLLVVLWALNQVDRFSDLD